MQSGLINYKTLIIYLLHIIISAVYLIRKYILIYLIL